MLRVCGFKRVDGKNRQTGEAYGGFSVYLLDQEPDSKYGVQGFEAQSHWLNDKYRSYTPTIGDYVRLSYNRFGKVSDLIPVEKDA